MFSDYEKVLLALCIYREARGEVSEARRAVAWTVRNRIYSNTHWWGRTWAEVITKPYQFSSFNRNDPNVTVFPLSEDSAWLDCLAIASEVYEGHGGDVSGGATHYHDDSIVPPTWTGNMNLILKVGRLNFYKEKSGVPEPYASNPNV